MTIDTDKEKFLCRLGVTHGGCTNGNGDGILRKLPTPQELKEQLPVSTEVVAVKAQRDEEIRNIFEGKDDRLILVIGPCSADNEDAVIDYISRLRTVQEKVKDKIFIIPRIYTNKPRTIGVGYKGMLHQPDPEKKRIC